MNDEEFEHKLRALTEKLARPDPTPGWKSEILAHARSEAAIRVPRWPLLTLGMAWVCIAALHIATPGTAARRDYVVGPDPRVETGIAFGNTPDTPLQALLALQSNPEFPDHP
jgi:hypothetical protein